MKNESCFKNPDRPTWIDVFLTNSPHSFHNTMTISTRLSDFYGMIITVLKSLFIKLMAREIYYRDYQNFSTNSFREDLTLSLNSINKAFNSFEDTFMKTFNRRARMKKQFFRANGVPYMSRAIMKRSELESKYLKNKSHQNMKIYESKNTVAANYRRRKENFFFLK